MRHTSWEKATHALNVAEIVIEMEDKEQGGGGVQRVVVTHRLRSTFCIIHQPLSCVVFFLFLPAPSHCRRYQRHQLCFNLH